jgi:predicted transcriptional regulator
MYSPKVADEHVRRLFRIRSALHRPMTQLVAEALEAYLTEQEAALALPAAPLAGEDGYAVTASGREWLRRYGAARGAVA